MISFKRTKKRNYRNPGEKYMLMGLAGMFVILLALMLSAISGRNRLQLRMDETREMIAASIQSDMNEVISSYEAIDRKSADLQDDILPTMRKHMYTANEMNRILTETFGEEYSMIDPEQYESFEAIMARYDQLLAAGQSTSPARESLTACMESLETALANRFTADGGLLPKTASTSTHP